MLKRIFKNISFWIAGGMSEKEHKSVFDAGYKSGKEEGIREGMAKNFERSVELSDYEYKRAMDFLVANGLDVCCYDVHKGGFRIRKRRAN